MSTRKQVLSRCSGVLLLAVLVAMLSGCAAMGGNSTSRSTSHVQPAADTSRTLVTIASDLFTVQRGGNDEAEFSHQYQQIASRLATVTAATPTQASAVQELRLALRYDDAAGAAWRGLIGDEDITGTVPARWIKAYPDLVLLLPDGYPSGVIDYEDVSDYCLERAAEHSVAAAKLLGGPVPDDSTAPLVRPRAGSVQAAVLKALERRASAPAHFWQDVWLWPEEIRIKGTWAFAVTLATQAGGLPINWDGIARSGAGDARNVDALLHKSGGQWKIIRYVWSPSDVAWSDWHKIKGVPKGLVD